LVRLLFVLVPLVWLGRSNYGRASYTPQSAGDLTVPRVTGSGNQFYAIPSVDVSGSWGYLVQMDGVNATTGNVTFASVYWSGGASSTANFFNPNQVWAGASITMGEGNQPASTYRFWWCSEDCNPTCAITCSLSSSGTYAGSADIPTTWSSTPIWYLMGRNGLMTGGFGKPLATTHGWDNCCQWTIQFLYSDNSGAVQFYPGFIASTSEWRRYTNIVVYDMGESFAVFQYYRGTGQAWTTSMAMAISVRHQGTTPEPNPRTIMYAGGQVLGLAKYLDANVATLGWSPRIYASSTATPLIGSFNQDDYNYMILCMAYDSNAQIATWSVSTSMGDTFQVLGMASFLSNASFVFTQLGSAGTWYPSIFYTSRYSYPDSDSSLAFAPSLLQSSTNYAAPTSKSLSFTTYSVTDTNAAYFSGDSKCFMSRLVYLTNANSWATTAGSSSYLTATPSYRSNLFVRAGTDFAFTLRLGTSISINQNLRIVLMQRVSTSDLSSGSKYWNNFDHIQIALLPSGSTLTMYVYSIVSNTATQLCTSSISTFSQFSDYMSTTSSGGRIWISYGLGFITISAVKATAAQTVESWMRCRISRWPPLTTQIVSVGIARSATSAYTIGSAQLVDMITGMPGTMDDFFKVDLSNNITASSITTKGGYAVSVRLHYSNATASDPILNAYLGTAAGWSLATRMTSSGIDLRMQRTGSAVTKRTLVSLPGPATLATLAYTNLRLFFDYVTSTVLVYFESAPSSWPAATIPFALLDLSAEEREPFVSPIFITDYQNASFIGDPSTDSYCSPYIGSSTTQARYRAAMQLDYCPTGSTSRPRAYTISGTTTTVSVAGAASGTSSSQWNVDVLPSNLRSLLRFTNSTSNGIVDQRRFVDATISGVTDVMVLVRISFSGTVTPAQSPVRLSLVKFSDTTQEVTVSLGTGSSGQDAVISVGSTVLKQVTGVLPSSSTAWSQVWMYYGCGAISAGLGDPMDFSSGTANKPLIVYTASSWPVLSFVPESAGILQGFVGMTVSAFNITTPYNYEYYSLQGAVAPVQGATLLATPYTLFSADAGWLTVFYAASSTMATPSNTTYQLTFGTPGSIAFSANFSAAAGILWSGMPDFQPAPVLGNMWLVVDGATNRFFVGQTPAGSSPSYHGLSACGTLSSSSYDVTRFTRVRRSTGDDASTVISGPATPAYSASSFWGSFPYTTVSCSSTTPVLTMDFSPSLPAPWQNRWVSRVFLRNSFTDDGRIHGPIRLSLGWYAMQPLLSITASFYSTSLSWNGASSTLYQGADQYVWVAHDWSPTTVYYDTRSYFDASQSQTSTSSIYGDSTYSITAICNDTTYGGNAALISVFSDYSVLSASSGSDTLAQLTTVTCSSVSTLDASSAPSLPITTSTVSEFTFYSWQSALLLGSSASSALVTLQTFASTQSDVSVLVKAVISATSFNQIRLALVAAPQNSQPVYYQFALGYGPGQNLVSLSYVNEYRGIAVVLDERFMPGRETASSSNTMYVPFIQSYAKVPVWIMFSCGLIAAGIGDPQSQHWEVLALFRDRTSPPLGGAAVPLSVALIQQPHAMTLHSLSVIDLSSAPTSLQSQLLDYPASNSRFNVRLLSTATVPYVYGWQGTGAGEVSAQYDNPNGWYNRGGDYWTQFASVQSGLISDGGVRQLFSDRARVGLGRWQRSGTTLQLGWHSSPDLSTESAFSSASATVFICDGRGSPPTLSVALATASGNSYTPFALVQQIVFPFCSNVWWIGGESNAAFPYSASISALAFPFQLLPTGTADVLSSNDQAVQPDSQYPLNVYTSGLFGTVAGMTDGGSPYQFSLTIENTSSFDQMTFALPNDQDPVLITFTSTALAPLLNAGHCQLSLAVMKSSNTLFVSMAYPTGSPQGVVRVGSTSKSSAVSLSSERSPGIATTRSVTLTSAGFDSSAILPTAMGIQSQATLLGWTFNMTSSATTSTGWLVTMQINMQSSNGVLTLKLGSATQFLLPISISASQITLNSVVFTTLGSLFTADYLSVQLWIAGDVASGRVLVGIGSYSALQPVSWNQVLACASVANVGQMANIYQDIDGSAFVASVTSITSRTYSTSTIWGQYPFDTAQCPLVSRTSVSLHPLSSVFTSSWTQWYSRFFLPRTSLPVVLQMVPVSGSQYTITLSDSSAPESLSFNGQTVQVFQGGMRQLALVGSRSTGDATLAYQFALASQVFSASIPASDAILALYYDAATYPALGAQAVQYAEYTSGSAVATWAGTEPSCSSVNTITAGATASSTAVTATSTRTLRGPHRCSLVQRCRRTLSRCRRSAPVQRRMSRCSQRRRSAARRAASAWFWAVVLRRRSTISLRLVWARRAVAQRCRSSTSHRDCRCCSTSA
jgi:hypothetical protein